MRDLESSGFPEGKKGGAKPIISVNGPGFDPLGRAEFALASTHIALCEDFSTFFMQRWGMLAFLLMAHISQSIIATKESSVRYERMRT